MIVDSELSLMRKRGSGTSEETERGGGGGVEGRRQCENTHCSQLVMYYAMKASYSVHYMPTASCPNHNIPQS